jgi:hypothetical protein
VGGAGEAGRILMLGGAVLLGLGALLAYGPRIPWLGRLPGDVVYQRGGFTVYLPIVTCLLLSAVLTVVLALFRRH